MGRSVYSARDYKLVTSFETIRETLLQERFQDRLAKPLVYWALPNDRRLPLAFLNRSIGELVNTPFDELTATPGVGQKKISSLVKLLMRATKDQPPSVPLSVGENPESGAPATEPSTTDEFNASLVSEALWSEWTAVIRKLGLRDETLGRVAESLSEMPTVIWTRTLGEYEDLSLAQIRRLRTHGEKRVRCVMQVFHRVYHLANKHSGEPIDALRRHLGSQRMLQVSAWLNGQLRNNGIPTKEEIRINLAEPVLEQIDIDCGDTVLKIAKQRLGIDSEPLTVREQAQSMGVTRARVYQLLDDCHKILEVRWPEGRTLLDRMTAQYGAHLGSQPFDVALFLAVRQLCFPDRNEYDMKPDLTGGPHFGSPSAPGFPPE